MSLNTTSSWTDNGGEPFLSTQEAHKSKLLISKVPAKILAGARKTPDGNRFMVLALTYDIRDALEAFFKNIRNHTKLEN
jgi:hypothetical protein